MIAFWVIERFPYLLSGEVGVLDGYSGEVSIIGYQKPIIVKPFVLLQDNIGKRLQGLVTELARSIKESSGEADQLYRLKLHGVVRGYLGSLGSVCVMGGEPDIPETHRRNLMPVNSRPCAKVTNSETGERLTLIADCYSNKQRLNTQDILELTIMSAQLFAGCPLNREDFSRLNDIWEKALSWNDDLK